jgi:hypothetical protein
VCVCVCVCVLMVCRRTVGCTNLLSQVGLFQSNTIILTNDYPTELNASNTTRSEHSPVCVNWPLLFLHQGKRKIIVSPKTYSEKRGKFFLRSADGNRGDLKKKQFSNNYDCWTYSDRHIYNTAVNSFFNGYTVQKRRLERRQTTICNENEYS